MMTTDELFAGDGWTSLHDALLDADGRVRTRAEVRAAFLRLPSHIRDIAHAWGLNDTVFRDAAYAEAVARHARSAVGPKA